MPGMPPPGPPTAYMPGPYMQPMQYPPGMPPPTGQCNLLLYKPCPSQTSANSYVLTWYGTNAT